MKKLVYFALASVGCWTVLTSCEKLMPEAPAADQVMDAPLEGLTHQQYQIFLEGAEEFDEVYTRETGLGPIFVATSCGGCHSADNRGHMSTILTRFGQSDTTGNEFLYLGGPQLQHRALPGFIPETIPGGATQSRFIAPIVSGTGFLELVSDQDILAMADPNDLDGDGISGVPNWNNIPDWVLPLPGAVTQNGKYICRFGRKASTYNLHQQTVGAFNQDMGIATSFLPQEPSIYTDGTQPVPLSEPEVSDRSVNATVYYLQVLQTPIQRNSESESVQRGNALFKQVGCESCHKETLRTSYSPVAAMNGVDFHPYTDLLLHDMGPELDDHYTEGSALTSEWRTSPLWGLGLAPNSQGGEYFLLHDGRARSIEEAIEYHGGEAAASRTIFRSLSQNERDLIIEFLKSL